MLYQLALVLLLMLPVCCRADAIQAGSGGKPAAHSLSALLTSRVVDLTHPLDTGIPHWQGFPPATRKPMFNYKPDGFLAEQFCHVGQWGTHVDPPGHFFAGMRMLDEISPREMILPLVVIDVHQQVAGNPDYTLTMNDINRWEQRHGPVPQGSFVVMRTDWSKRWPDQAKMMNKDGKGILHYPGWSMEALKYLYETRKITASGHETTDTDPGTATSQNDYSLEAYVLKQDHYQIEMLANLDQVPETGAIAIVTWPNVHKGSGFPARVLAVIPN